MNEFEEHIEKAYFECACDDLSHTIRMEYFADDSPESMAVFLTYHLEQNQGFFKRAWLGLKYLFGFRSRYGHFSEVVLTPLQTKKLYDYVSDFLKEYYKKQIEESQEIIAKAGADESAD